ncbi:MAG: polymer-forming cytoskeletal protein [Lutibacter sp.]|uniref:bactofilin family protein n=1 Tax=Lutibacter sp. TaxID=1925666 RepID=UPI00299DCAEB|nr:polymer-forming cytoskeletal protein [Lutibacter sp.]MDX1829644.1 polymer-forming cytoskeletal protein [Lutibacter sp.]
MFSEKKEKQTQVSERNVISKNTSIKGDIISEGDFRVEGNVEGTIQTAGRVIIGSSGSVKGKVTCNNADIDGKFSGELLVNNLLTLKATAQISGDVVISKLSVEPGAEFNATCVMKGSIKELKNEKATKEKTA